MARLRRQKEPWPRPRRGLLARWRDHRRIARETLHYVSARAGTSLLVWMLVGIALALPAGLYLLQVNLAAMSAEWQGRPGLSVYFELDADAEQVAALAGRLEQASRVDAVTVVSRQAALAEFERYAGLDDALALLDENPLPASLRATLSAGADAADLEALAALAGDAPGVDEVVVEKAWLERVGDMNRVVARLGGLLAALFGLGAVLITATSVRLAIEARLDEMRVLKLVGATDAQIRRPFLYYGAVYGLGGGMVAAMLISLGLVIVEQPLSELVGSYGRELVLVGFGPGFIAALFAAAGALGVMGAVMAARQRLADLEIR